MAVSKQLALSMALLLGAGALSGCSGSQAPAEPAPPAEAGAPQAGDTALPEGHPPLSGAPSSGIVPPPAGSGTGSSGLVWEEPEGWQAETPSSSMRKAQYRVPGPAGDGECVVYYFGPGQGGGAMANAERWAGMFTQPDGRSSTEVMETTSIEVAGMSVLLIEVTGTYSGGGPMMGGGEPQPDHMLLGAVAEGPDANWFFKLTGPEATVRDQKDAFQAMIKSLQQGGDPT